MNAPIPSHALPKFADARAPAVEPEAIADIDRAIEQIRSIQKFCRSYRHHPTRKLPEGLYAVLAELDQTARDQDGLLSAAVVFEMRQLLESCWRRRNDSHPPEEPVLGLCATALANLNYRKRVIQNGR